MKNIVLTKLSPAYDSTWQGSGLMLLILLAACGFFNLGIFPKGYVKFEMMFFCLLMLSYAFWYLYTNRQKKSLLLKPVEFILLVLLSFINAFFLNDQSISLSFRANYGWLYYSIFYFLIAKKIRAGEIYAACTIFVFIRLSLYYYTLLTGNLIFNLENEQVDMGGSRGVIRIYTPGAMITYFWGFWSLGKYLKYEKKIYMIFFLMTLLQSLLEVSRQHIVIYAVLSSLLLFYKLSILKKLLFTGVLLSFFVFILPQIKIYQELVNLTEHQQYATNGFRDDVRLNGIKYYILDYPQSIYTKVMGNSKYHYESKYGKKMNHIIQKYGFILSDIGFVGIYIYWGLLGLLFYAYLFYWVIRISPPLEFLSLKYFVCFLYFANIFSNSIEGSTMALPIALYIYYRKCYMNNYKWSILKKVKSIESVNG